MAEQQADRADGEAAGETRDQWHRVARLAGMLVKAHGLMVSALALLDQAAQRQAATQLDHALAILDLRLRDTEGAPGPLERRPVPD